MIPRRSLFLLPAAALLAVGQPPKRRRMPRYDPATETTFKGVIDEVKEVGPEDSPGKGIHLMLKTEATTLEVHIGPAAFIAKHELTLSKGDSIEVLGSKSTSRRGDFVIARSITKNGKTTKFRDEKGIPLWAGPGRKTRKETP